LYDIVIAAINPGIAWCATVICPPAASVAVIFPRSLYVFCTVLCAATPLSDLHPTHPKASTIPNATA